MKITVELCHSNVKAWYQLSLYNTDTLVLPYPALEQIQRNRIQTSVQLLRPLREKRRTNECRCHAVHCMVHLYWVRQWEWQQKGEACSCYLDLIDVMLSYMKAKNNNRAFNEVFIHWIELIWLLKTGQALLPCSNASMSFRLTHLCISFLILSSHWPALDFGGFNASFGSRTLTWLVHTNELVRRVIKLSTKCCRKGESAFQMQAHNLTNTRSNKKFQSLLLKKGSKKKWKELTQRRTEKATDGQKENK